MNSFVEGVSWPVGPASLAALCDIGMSVEQIARYFSVRPAAVSALLNGRRDGPVDSDDLEMA